MQQHAWQIKNLNEIKPEPNDICMYRTVQHIVWMHAVVALNGIFWSCSHCLETCCLVLLMDYGSRGYLVTLEDARQTSLPISASMMKAYADLFYIAFAQGTISSCEGQTQGCLRQPLLVSRILYANRNIGWLGLDRLRSLEITKSGLQSTGTHVLHSHIWAIYLNGPEEEQIKSAVCWASKKKLGWRACTPICEMSWLLSKGLTLKPWKMTEQESLLKQAWLQYQQCLSMCLTRTFWAVSSSAHPVWDRSGHISYYKDCQTGCVRDNCQAENCLLVWLRRSKIRFWMVPDSQSLSWDWVQPAWKGSNLRHDPNLR